MKKAVPKKLPALNCKFDPKVPKSKINLEKKEPKTLKSTPLAVHYRNSLRCYDHNPPVKNYFKPFVK